MNIQVTQHDIDVGEKDNCETCPIALATSRVYPDVYVAVRPLSVEVGDDMYRLPTVARLFIRDFDNGLGVEPMEFEL